MQTPYASSPGTLKVEHEISLNTSISIGYVGSHGYHELVGVDANESPSVICPAVCSVSCRFPRLGNPALPTSATNDPNLGFLVGSPLAGAPVPAGTFYIPVGTKKANPAIANTWTWFSEGVSTYHALQVDLRRRFSHGLTASRRLHTSPKRSTTATPLNQTTANNAPGLVSNPLNLAADKATKATFDVRHIGVVNLVYDLPFGRGRQFASDYQGWAGNLIGGWALSSVITAQSGFPITPQLSYNPSNSGDTRNPVRPFLNPDFTGKVVTGNPNQWFNPAAFIAPPSTSGFAGNLGRDTYIGPGLATWDFSVLKDTRLRRTPVSSSSAPNSSTCSTAPQFQYAQPDHLHAADCQESVWRLRQRRRHHLHQHKQPPSSIRPQAAL